MEQDKQCVGSSLLVNGGANVAVDGDTVFLSNGSVNGGEFSHQGLSDLSLSAETILRYASCKYSYLAQPHFRFFLQSFLVSQHKFFCYSKTGKSFIKTLPRHPQF